LGVLFEQQQMETVLVQFPFKEMGADLCFDL